MPPFVPGVSFAEALARFRAVGWREHDQTGSHLYLAHPKRPGVLLALPDHRRRDLRPGTLGGEVEKADLTAEQFHSLAGSGRHRNARQIRREVYGMES